MPTWSNIYIYRKINLEKETHWDLSKNVVEGEERKLEWEHWYENDSHQSSSAAKFTALSRCVENRSTCDTRSRVIALSISIYINFMSYNIYREKKISIKSRMKSILNVASIKNYLCTQELFCAALTRLWHRFIHVWILWHT